MDNQQIHDFLTKILEIPESDLALLKSDRLAFLTKLIAAINTRIPFQNLSTTVVPFEERHQPNMEENMDAFYSGLGGRCWTMNGAMNVFLKKIGYEVDAIICSVRVPNSRNHIMNLVKNIEKAGDQYLVDVGFGSASHPPVPLDFESESPVYSYYHQRIKWVKQGDVYSRMELYNPIAGKHFGNLEGDWENAGSFDLTAYSLDQIKQFIYESSYAQHSSTFNSKRYIMQMNREYNKFVYIRNERMISIYPDRTVEKVDLKDESQVLKAIQRYFPNFPVDIAKQSYKRWYMEDRNFIDH